MSQTNMPWWVVPALAIVLELIFAGAIVASCFLADTTLRTTMFTGALTLGTMVASFYFGSSSGSQKKDETIAAMTPAPIVQLPPAESVTVVPAVPPV